MSFWATVRGFFTPVSYVQYASSDCKACDGSGLIGHHRDGPMDYCPCVWRNYHAQRDAHVRETLAHNARVAEQRRAWEAYVDQQRAEFHQHINEPLLPDWTPERLQEHSDGVRRRRALLEKGYSTLDFPRMVRHEISICCRSRPCVCGEEHWWKEGEWG